MSKNPCAVLQAFLNDFERYHELRSRLLDLGIDVYDHSPELKAAHADLATRLPLVQNLAADTGVSEAEISLVFRDDTAASTREAVLRALGAYQHGLVKKGVRAVTMRDAGMSWKERVEKSPLFYALTIFIAGCAAGWGAHKYLGPLLEQPPAQTAPAPAVWGP